MAVYKDHSAPPEVGGHVVLGIAQPETVADNVIDFKRVITGWEEARIERQFPSLHGLLRYRVRAEIPAGTRPPAFHNSRALDNDLRARSGFIADHGIWSRTTARRAYKFAIDSF